MTHLRQRARLSIQGRAEVLFQQQRLAFDVVNLSTGGVLLRNGPLIPSDSDVEITISWKSLETLPLRARVLRAPDPETGTGSLALAFQDLREEEEGKLAHAISEGFTALGAKVLGLVKQEMHREGITDASLVADELHRIRLEQSQNHLFTSDLFTEQGSDSTATIVSGTTGSRRECIVWSLNLYLGLNRHPLVIERAVRALQTFGTGCGTSAPSGGLNALHHEVEARIATLLGKERAIVFSTGYATNLGALSALPGPKDLVLLDREAHASMFDGVRLSGRKFLAFKHNDAADLEEKLIRFGPNHENIFVVVESAYSMSGDLAPLRDFVALKKTRPFFLYVDEAHTFGLYGEQGRGWCHEQGVIGDVDFIMSTFSKATASIGGFFAADARWCTMLQATSTPYIFQACLPPADAAAILAALEVIEHEPRHRLRLHENNRLMRSLLVEEGFDLGQSQSPVIPVFVSDLEKLYRLCSALFQEGIFSVPVVYPAVGVNEGRIRFIVNAHHSEAQIRRTVSVLAGLARDLGVLPL
jgi:glycine C-acetyltransferase